MIRIGIRTIAALALTAFATVTPSRAEDIVSAWSSVKMPPAPDLKPLKVDPAHTALLLLDFNTHICNERKRPRCADTLPSVAALLADARLHGVMVVYSTVLPATLDDVPHALAALPGDPVVHSGVDKFLGTDLDAILRARNINTVIVTGTSADGAVLYTASAAALRKYETVIPVDGMSGDDAFSELSTAWIVVNAPTSVSSHTLLTRSSMIGY